MEDRDHRPERDDREGDEGRGGGDDRGQDEHDLVHAQRDDVFLERQLEPSASGCSRPNGPARFGPGRCCIRPITRRSNQIIEQRHDAAGTRRCSTALSEDQPPGVVAEVQQRRIVAVGPAGRAAGLPAASWPAAQARLLIRDSPALPDRDPAAVPGAELAADRAAGRVRSAARRPGPACRRPAAGSGDRAGVGGHRDLVAVGDADLRRGRRGHRLRPAGARCRPGTARRPAAGRRRAAGCQVASTASPVAGGRARPARSRPAARRRGAVPGAERGQLAAGRGDVGQPEVHVHLVGERVEDPEVGLARRGRSSAGARTSAPRPSQSTNVPAFSATAATGSTTSARSVTALARSSRLTTNGGRSSAPSAAAGSGRSSGSTPPTTSASSSPAAAAARICGGVAARRARGSESGPAPGAGDLGPGLRRRRPDGRPGSRVGSAPASSAPRSPARRGTQASRAPVACGEPRPPRSARRAPRPAARRPG